MKLFVGMITTLLTLYAPDSPADSWYRCSSNDAVQTTKIFACEAEKKSRNCQDFSALFEKNKESATLIGNCDTSSSTFEILNATANCSGAAIALGISKINALKPGYFGKKLPALLLKLAPKIAAVFEIAAVPLTVYSLYDLTAEAIAEDKKCFEDIQGKRDVLEFLKISGDRVGVDIKSYATSDQIRSVSFAPEYLKDEFVRRLSCQELRRMVMVQKNKQDAVIGPLVAQRKLLQDPRKVFELTTQEEQMLKLLAANSECISPARQAALICAVGNLSLGARLGVKKYLENIKLKDPENLVSAKLVEPTQKTVAKSSLNSDIDKKSWDDYSGVWQYYLEADPPALALANGEVHQFGRLVAPGRAGIVYCLSPQNCDAVIKLPMRLSKSREIIDEIDSAKELEAAGYKTAKIYDSRKTGVPYLIKQRVEGTPLDLIPAPNRPQLTDLAKIYIRGIRKRVFPDITPSNFIWQEADQQFVLIDHGSIIRKNSENEKALQDPHVFANFMKFSEDAKRFLIDEIDRLSRLP